VPVAERALEIWPNVCKFVDATIKKPKAQQPSCNNTVMDATRDALFQPRLHTFLSIARQLQPFLTLYQTDRPMIPFMADDLNNLLRALMKRFVKSDVLRSADSLSLLIKVDVNKHENHHTYSKIDVGFAADKKLKELQVTKKVSDRQLLEYRMEVKDFLVAVVAKILDKAPIKYPVVH
jgi:hypothetical protein